MSTKHQSGFTSLELVVTMSILGLATAMLGAALGTPMREDRTTLDARLAHRAIEEVAQLFVPAGIVDNAGPSFPLITTVTEPQYDVDQLGEVVVLTPAHREVSFQIVADDDNDGWPDVDANHEATWSTQASVLRVASMPNGLGSLVYESAAGVTRTLCNRVVRLDVEDWNIRPAELPYGTLRITLEVARRDAYDEELTITVQRTLRLTNSAR